MGLDNATFDALMAQQAELLALHNIGVGDYQIDLTFIQMVIDADSAADQYAHGKRMARVAADHADQGVVDIVREWLDARD